MSMRERFIEALIKRGETEVKRMTKVFVYTAHKISRPGCFYYLGRSGSIRIGSTLKGSIPISEAHKQALLGSISKPGGI